MGKKFGYTLVECLVVLVILSLIIVVISKTIKTYNYQDDGYYALGTKIISTLDETFLQIRLNEKTICPTGNFIEKNGNSQQKTLNVSDSTALINLLGNYIKFSQTGINFCDYTTSCTTTIAGAKIQKDVYIGVEVFSNLKDCPEFYLPKAIQQSPAPTEFDPSTGNSNIQKCWGKIYIDVAGKKGSAVQGKNYYTFGLNNTGLAK